MIIVRVNKKTKACSIVDEAEGTPGVSRQITRFREYCLPVFEVQVKSPTMKHKDIEFSEFEFKFLRMDEDNNTITFSWESTTK